MKIKAQLELEKLLSVGEQIKKQREAAGISPSLTFLYS